MEGSGYISRKLSEEELKAILQEPYIDSYTLSRQIGTPASTIRNIRRRNGVHLDHCFNPDINEFVELALKYKKASPLMEYYNVERRTILYFADKLGINLRIGRVLTPQQEQDIIDQYYNKSATELAYEYNVSSSKISAIWMKAGLKGKASRVYHLLNETAFANIDSESAYLLGFIGADGCLYKYSNEEDKMDILSIGVQAGDIKILELFRRKLQTDKPIYHIRHRDRNYVSLQISSNIISNDLQKLDISYRKTYGNTIANISDEYMPHLIRGYLDGDGYIKDIKFPSDARIAISGYKQNLMKIAEYCNKRNIFPSFSHDTRKYQNDEENPFGSLVFDDKTSIYCFLKMIYEECGDYYLDHKKDNADKFVNYIESSVNVRDKQIVIYYNNAVCKRAS